MDRSIEEIVLDVHVCNPNNEFLSFLESIAQEITNHPHGSKAMGAIFLMIEKYPDEDFGSPGSIVHALESFSGQGYEVELIKSIKRKITYLNLWMLNRLINASSGLEKEEYIDLLSKIVCDINLEEDIHDEAVEYLNRHLS